MTLSKNESSKSDHLDPKPEVSLTSNLIFDDLSNTNLKICKQAYKEGMIEIIIYSNFFTYL